MSKLLIGQYLNDLSLLKQVSGTNRESVVREAFKDLLKGYARSHDLVFVPEFEIESPARERRYVDGALLHALRRSEEHTSELQSLMRISYAVFCLKKKKQIY